MNNKLLKQTKEHCLKTLEKRKDNICLYLPGHIDRVKKWAEKIMKDYPADKEIVLLSVYLHDIGHGFGNHKDHDLRSEIEAKSFLKKSKLSEDKIDEVSHCVRAHRCRDVMPETIEAKILAAADSLSHLTDGVYIEMAINGKKDLALKKLKRDYRDTKYFPKIRKQITPIYKAWKKFLEVYPNI